jgi:two-component system sensor histidine kinase AlgZ
MGNQNPQGSTDSAGAPAEEEDRFFLPDLCNGQAVLLLILVAELLVLVLVIWKGGLAPFDWVSLAVVTLFAQWLALTSAACLCALRPFLKRLSVAWGAALSYVVVLLLCVILTLLGTVLLDVGLGRPLNLAIDPGVVAKNLLVTGLLAGIALRYFYLQAQLQRQHQAELRARIQALQSRIRPHFLFNSMNSIASLIELNPKAAETAVEDLAALFRASLREASAEISFEEELNLCHCYLRIEQHRLGERLQVDWKIADLPDGLRIPALTLQPLLENAIYHGVQPIAEGGLVEIQVGLEAGCCNIEVRNPVEKTTNSQQPDNGNNNRMAVANIDDRLRAIYGSSASLTLAVQDGKHIARVSYPVAGFEV